MIQTKITRKRKMIYNFARGDSHTLSRGTRVKIIRLIEDTSYNKYKDRIKDQIATVEFFWTSGRPVFRIPSVRKDNDTGTLFSLDHIELIRLDDPDENY